jgi:hypothetical protein
VCYWGSKGDVTHALATSDRFSNEVTFFIDGSFAGTNAFKFGIVWVNIFDWAEDSFAE